MELNTPIHEIITRFFKFKFYNDYFTCQYKMNFRKREIKIAYTDIDHIEQQTTYVNFLPCYEYRIFLNNVKKPTLLCCNNKRQLPILIEAMAFIGEQRTKLIMAKINELSNSTENINEQKEIMMFCRYCGKLIEADSTFCKFCGKAL